MFIFFFMQWLRKPIWGYPLMNPCAYSLKSTFQISSYGGTRLPDTGKNVVPWEILDWWTSQECGGQPEKELWFVTTGWQSRIWQVRMGRRSCNEPVPAASIIGQKDALLSGSSSARQECWCTSAHGWNIIHMSVSYRKQGSITWNPHAADPLCNRVNPVFPWRRVLAHQN